MKMKINEEEYYKVLFENKLKKAEEEKEIEKRVPLCRDEITLCVIVSHKGTSCSRHLLQR